MSIYSDYIVAFILIIKNNSIAVTLYIYSFKINPSTSYILYFVTNVTTDLLMHLKLESVIERPSYFNSVLFIMFRD